MDKLLHLFGPVQSVVPGAPTPARAVTPVEPATRLSAQQILGAPGSAADPAAPAGVAPLQPLFQ
eukprot:9056914-Pyramimonas_sp.AAC.1